MAEVTRVVTFDTGDDCISRRSNVTVGICADIWYKIASDLDLKFTIDIVDQWIHMLEYLNNNKTDVILQRVEEGNICINVTK